MDFQSVFLRVGFTILLHLQFKLIIPQLTHLTSVYFYSQPTYIVSYSPSPSIVVWYVKSTSVADNRTVTLRVDIWFSITQTTLNIQVLLCYQKKSYQFVSAEVKVTSKVKRKLRSSTPHYQEKSRPCS